VAVQLAAVVCADVTVDTSCDPIELAGPPAAAAAVSNDTASPDACAPFCVLG